MVLRRDFHLSGLEVLYRLIGSAVSEFQFERPAAQGLPENLVPQTNAKDRDPGFDQATDGLDGVAERGRVAGSVGQENTGGFVFQRLGSRRGRGQYLHPETALAQPAENVVFHPEIISDDREVRRPQGITNGTRVPGQVAADQFEIAALVVFRVP